jgi:cytochrome d ubiquinol oxidase subunit I
MSLAFESIRVLSTITGTGPGSPALFLPVELASRLQFGWTITVHIIFAMLSVGLAPFIIYFTYREIRHGSDRYARLRSFWVKVFALGFVMGTVTGIPMSFQFGTNFPIFSEFAGELIGGPLAFEAKMAFFLEAVFLGVMLFGRDRVSDRAYLGSSVLVGIGAWLSAFWIIVVNAWMQTPQGFEVITRNSREVARLTDPIAGIFTPRLPWMYLHTVNAAVLSVALVVAGIAGYFVWMKRDSVAWRSALRIAVVVLLITAPLQAIHGDAYARHVEDTQPQKFASMEAHYDTGQADLHLLAFPKNLNSFTDPRAENLWTVSIPGLGSFLASGGDFNAEILGLNAYEENPPVALVFWSFRLMVGLGFLFIALALWGAYLLWKRRLSESDRYLRAMMLATPLGFVAIETGWYVAEIGRQPWIVQQTENFAGLKTGASVSQSLGSTEATLSLAAFVVIYIGLMAAFLYVVKLLIEGELAEMDVRESDAKPRGPRLPWVGGDD